MRLQRRTRFWWALVPLGLAILGLPAQAQQEAGQVPQRADIAEQHKWDLTDMFPDVNAWEADFAACQKGIDQVVALKGTLGRSPESLLAAFELVAELSVKFERVFAYAMLLRDQDTRAAEPQALFDRAGSLVVKFREATSWIKPEILTMSEGTLAQWCESNHKLAIYRHKLDNLLRQRKHVLSAREEELLAMSGKLAQAPHQAFTMLANADLKFATIKDPQGNDLQISEGRYVSCMQSPDRAFRRRAFNALLQSYLACKNTIAALLAGSVHKDVFNARTHNYGSALEAALGPDNVPREVYTNLIATVRNHLPKLHRYMEIRRRKLEIDKVHVYDTFIPLVDEEPPKIAYEDAVNTIIDGLAPMGGEYLAPMKTGFTGRWIDVYETRGKKSGAYSMGTYATHPYVLLNYDGTYHDMFTVAHELGHSMHSWFTQHSQPPVYGDYPIFLAEVASTANEIILGQYLRSRATSAAEKLFLLNLAIESIRGTVIKQTMWAEFELLIHQVAERGEPLTYETMSSIYEKLVKEYNGPAYGHDDAVNGYWLRIPHFYRGFYVYKYATSYCAATALATRVLNDEPGALDAYMNFLKAGSSDYPINILKSAGVDMSTPKPIDDTMKLFGRLLAELERLLGY